MTRATNEYRIGDAARQLGVRVETIRRWEREKKIRLSRTAGGQRTVPASEVARLLNETRARPAISAESVRNRFPGVVTEVKKDRLIATVEIQAGPFRILSVVTREAVDEMGLKPGIEAIAAMKATNVTIELAQKGTSE